MTHYYTRIMINADGTASPWDQIDEAAINKYLTKMYFLVTGDMPTQKEYDVFYKNSVANIFRRDEYPLKAALRAVDVEDVLCLYNVSHPSADKEVGADYLKLYDLDWEG